MAPHNVVLDAAACESAIYAEIKALTGGATSTIGSLYPNQDHPRNGDCAKGLVRNLDLVSGLDFKPPDPKDNCGKSDPIADVAAYEIFPLEVPHARLDYLLCELGTGSLHE